MFSSVFVCMSLSHHNKLQNITHIDIKMFMNFPRTN